MKNFFQYQNLKGLAIFKLGEFPIPEGANVVRSGVEKTLIGLTLELMIISVYQNKIL